MSSTYSASFIDSGDGSSIGGSFVDDGATSRATTVSFLNTGNYEPYGGIPYLASYLGYQNVFVNGVPWSFSQQGDFTACQWDVPGESISTTGPNAEFPIGELRRRHWEIHRKLIIYGFNLQSNTVGANSNLAGTIDPTTPFMQLAPIPNVLQAFTGGFTPTQGGVNPPTVDEIIDPAQYAGLVPGHENINTGRTPGGAVNRQMWSSAFGQVIAAAVPDDNVVLIINVGHGGTSYAEDVRHAETLASASWSGGVVTFIFNDDTMIAANDQFNVSVASPTTYQGIYTALTSDGITVTAALVSNPGVFVSGFALVASAPMINLRTMVRYAVNTIAPALGLTPYFAGMGCNGNESSDELNAIANWVSQLTDLRALVNELGDICGNAEDPYIIWPQVGWPIASWRVTDPTLPGTANMVALGVLAYSRDPANKLITYAQYSSVAGGDGNSNVGGCIHYGVQGHFDNGERGANLFLDKVVDSLDVQPLQLTYGENVLVRVANSTTVAGAFNKPATIDTTMQISDPGNHGGQYFSGVTGSGETFDGGAGLSSPVTSISVNATTFGMVLNGQPANQWGNWIGVAYNNATQYQAQNNTAVIDATWAAGVVTYTTIAPHGLGVGVPATVFGLTPSVIWDTVPSQLTLAGTTGSTIKLAKTVDPGTPYVSGGSIANNGEFGVGRVAGLRSQIRETDSTHYSTSTGARLDKMHAIQFVPVDVYPSSKSIVTMLTELGMSSTFQLVLDFANSSCYSGSTNQITNLGTSGATDNFWRGLSNVDATRTPTFNGSAGALNRTAFFSASANGKICTPQNTTDIFANLHKVNGEATFICGLQIPGAPATNTYLIANCQVEGGGTQGPGSGIRIGTNSKLTITIKGDGTATTLSQTSTKAIPSGTFAMVAVGIKNGSNQSWMYVYDGVDTTTSAGFETFSPVYANVSTNPAQSNAYIWQNGSTGTVRSLLNQQIFFELGSNTFLTEAQVLPLMRGLYRRQMQNLP